MEARWASQGFIHVKTNHTAGELFFAVKDSLKDNTYMYLGNDIVYIYENTTIGGNLDVGKVLTLKRTPGVSDTNPLTIINESPGGGTGVVYQSTASDQGFLIAYTTAQSSVAWVEGVNWGGSNEFIIKSGSNGLTLKPTGDAAVSGNLDVGQDQAQTSIKAYVNHVGYTGNVQIEARWRSQGFIHFNTNCPEGLLSFAVKGDLYMYVGIEVVYLLQTNHKCIRWQAKRKRKTY